MSPQRLPFDPDRVRTPSAKTPPKGPLTVSQITALVQNAIQSALPGTVHVVGEISNFKRHDSGHLYFTLKDNTSELSCVMWRSDAARLRFDPHDGLEVIASGTLDVFERAGRYQLYARRLQPKGIGELELAFRRLCENLKRQGLFDPAHKKKLPPFPTRIAIVTSPTGAAVADIIRTLDRRFPGLHLLVYPVRVQGNGAATEIAEAIRLINANGERLGGIDLIITGRGGGSLEDLWAFNEESVARAIFASAIPVISAVGHEVDLTVADLVADVRAATPTAAAELAVSERNEWIDELTTLTGRIKRATQNHKNLSASRLVAATSKPLLRNPLDLVHRREQILDELTYRMTRYKSARIHATRQRIDRAEAIIRHIAPHAYLSRIAGNLREVVYRLNWAIHKQKHDADQKLQRLAETIPTIASHRFDLARGKVGSLKTVLTAVSHKSVLQRGFSITRLKKDRTVVRSVKNLTDRRRLITQLTDGEIESETVNVHQMELFD